MLARPRTLVSIIAVLGLAATAHADHPRGTFIEISPLDHADPVTAFGGEPTNVIYLNGCFDTCGLIRGPEDSRNNSSSIINFPSASVPAFPYGEEAWQTVVDCVRNIYSPFNIEIVDQDPGNLPHWEALVAGRPGDLGFPNNVGGVAPFSTSCGVIPNAITFTFAEVFGGDLQVICEVVAQETAHAFGLDHEYLCTDPMTYLPGCHPKTFQNVDAPCGEFEERTCACGSPTQNSFATILGLFGEGVPTPPEVAITEPSAGDRVAPRFTVLVDATDNIAIDRVELYIDGELVATDDERPFRFSAPELSEGDHELEARAIDTTGTPASASIPFVQGPPCASATECGEGKLCHEGRCVVGPGNDGGLGAACAGPNDCASGLCVSDGIDQRCVEDCAQSCPCDFSCLSTGDGAAVCWPGGNDCGGCTVAPVGRPGDRSPALPLLFGLAVGGLLALRRR